MGLVNESLKTMQGVIYDPKDEINSFKVRNIDIPAPSQGEVLIKLYAAAINRRDYHIFKRARYTESWNPFIPGSDGSGLIVDKGEGVEGWDIGDEVITNPFLFCGNCQYCLENKHAVCELDEDLGGPSNGTFAQYITLPIKNIILKPSYLTHDEAAALPLALGTAWRVLITRGKLLENETLLIQGIGSGVATFMLQIAAKLGAKVIVTSSSNDKLDKAIQLGADFGINYKEENVVERILEITNGRGVDLVVDSSGKDSFDTSVASLRKEGRIVSFGTTTGVMDINFMKLIMRQATFITSNMFGPKELNDGIEFFKGFQLKPSISGYYSLENISEAFRDLESNNKFGKLVVKMD